MSFSGDSRAPTSLRSPTSNTPQSADGILCNPFPCHLSQASLDELTRAFGIRGHRPRCARPPRTPTVCHGHPVQSFSLPPLSSKLGRVDSEKSCGERGIRTPETLLEFTRFPGVPLQPLEHLSFVIRGKHLTLKTTPSFVSILNLQFGTIHLTTRKGTKNNLYMHYNL